MTVQGAEITFDYLHDGIETEAISRLPESYRIVVELRDIQEFSTDEVAQMLEMTLAFLRDHANGTR